jgi:hypothetical protein
VATIVPSSFSIGAEAMPFRTGSCHSPFQSRYMVAMSRGNRVSTSISVPSAFVFTR